MPQDFQNKDLLKKNMTHTFLLIYRKYWTWTRISELYNKPVELKRLENLISCSEVRTVFYRSHTGIAGSKPASDMDIHYVCIYHCLHACYMTPQFLDSLTLLQIKGKVKLVHHAMKMYCGSGSITPHILDLGTRWRWVVSFTLRPLCP
jgi:hypothetical protein